MTFECFKINGKVYLKGDFNQEENAYEYFDMTTEIETGHSYSQYIFDDAELERATDEERTSVIEYIKTLQL